MHPNCTKLLGDALAKSIITHQRALNDSIPPPDFLADASAHDADLWSVEIVIARRATAAFRSKLTNCTLVAAQLFRFVLE
jgi:hypothetical protein